MIGFQTPGAVRVNVPVDVDARLYRDAERMQRMSYLEKLILRKLDPERYTRMWHAEQMVGDYVRVNTAAQFAPVIAPRQKGMIERLFTSD